jgi:hypothetical protein
LDAAYITKAKALAQSYSSGIYSLEICDEILKPLMQKYPLIQILYESYSARSDSAILNDLAEYLENKLNSAAVDDSEEKSA